MMQLSGATIFDIYFSSFKVDAAYMMVVTVGSMLAIYFMPNGRDVGVQAVAPFVLLSIQTPLSLYLLLSLTKSASKKTIFFVFTMVNSLLALGAPILIYFLTTTMADQLYISWIMSALFAMNPTTGCACIVSKLFFRGRYAMANPNDKDIGIFSQNSVLPDMIGQLICIVLLPCLIYRKETANLRMVNDGTFNQIDRDEKLKAQLKDADKDPEATKMDTDVAAEAARVK